MFIRSCFSFDRFLNAAKQDSEILIAAQTLKRGKSTAFLTVDITDKETGKLLVTGRHTKFLA